MHVHILLRIALLYGDKNNMHLNLAEKPRGN